MGFRQFMCKIEGKPPPVVFEDEDTLYARNVSRVINIRAHYCQSVLDGEYEDLVEAFTWESTPQGHRYWGSRSDGDADLTRADLDFIRAVMREGESREENYDDDF